MIAATYEIHLKLNGIDLGDIRPIAESLTWSRYRTNYGIDAIEFTLNDHLFQEWAQARSLSIADLLKPIALEAVIIRNGEAVAGGFLASLPAYQPLQATASLAMRFDGFMNLMAGIILPPTATTTKRADQFITTWFAEANLRSSAAGKGYNFSQGTIEALPSITRTYENYKTAKEAILQMTDNADGAGIFDVIINPDKSFDITASLGRTITDWGLYYPPRDAGQSIATISADEIQGFASRVITLGAGEVSSDPAKTTVITSRSIDAAAVAEFGYYETMTQYSSVTNQATLDAHNAKDLRNATNLLWQPRITLIGAYNPPSPTASYGLWLGDKINITNTADATGMTSGQFRVQSFTVNVSATGAETVTPELERTA